MLEHTEMALKYPHPLDTFHQFLTDCGFIITNHDASGGKECFRLSNGSVVNLFPTGTIQIQGVPASKPEVEGLIGERLGIALVQTMLVQTAQEQPKKIFIVHGHDHAAKEQLELILHKLGLPDHFILQNTGGTGLTIIEELEREIGQGQTGTRFGIVLLTPDDMGYSKRDGETGVQPRARQNVVLEMGMLLSSLGRSNVVILQKQHLEQPSDANGILYLNFNEHVREVVPRLVQRLQHSGFEFTQTQLANASS
ncbi:TIR domain-containing protein [Yersinia intermedia]|uniref:Predicted nucleotide-binding protein containing TIR-like domain n=1 Tax=Yersinia intermedia TaxID=631 RepID=A0A0T9N004_YERIN|nr:nucleotide-binding protein [Yersinia intermedia]CNG65155.1 Predicted nucleotide-binding protein containing TIR-like domain [Yersinia intermedia]